MGTGEKSIVVKHVGKGVIVDSKKHMYRWVHMEKRYNENVMVKF
jgi:UDP-N-acetylglucosamine transferase subunit ALG13